MSDFSAFVSPEYPVLYSLRADSPAEPESAEAYAALSLAVLVKGIPSFLATVPVEEGRLDRVVASLESGNVRVAVVGIAVDGSEVPGEEHGESWKAHVDDESDTLPAAFLSLVCTDGRRIGVARIVARQRTASPEEVARYVLRQITRGVQVPDLASAG
jgi:hypothetical protein